MSIYTFSKVKVKLYDQDKFANTVIIIKTMIATGDGMKIIYKNMSDLDLQSRPWGPQYLNCYWPWKCICQQNWLSNTNTKCKQGKSPINMTVTIIFKVTVLKLLFWISWLPGHSIETALNFVIPCPTKNPQCISFVAQKHAMIGKVKD